MKHAWETGRQIHKSGDVHFSHTPLPSPGKWSRRALRGGKRNHRSEDGVRGTPRSRMEQVHLFCEGGPFTLFQLRSRSSGPCW